MNRNNINDMDEFYIAAAYGVDWETGEVVDRAKFEASIRDEEFYWNH